MIIAKLILIYAVATEIVCSSLLTSTIYYIYNVVRNFCACTPCLNLLLLHTLSYQKSMDASSSDCLHYILHTQVQSMYVSLYVHGSSHSVQFSLAGCGVVCGVVWVK